MARPFKNKPVAYILQDPTKCSIALKLCNRNTLNINFVNYQ